MSTKNTPTAEEERPTYEQIGRIMDLLAPSIRRLTREQVQAININGGDYKRYFEATISDFLRMIENREQEPDEIVYKVSMKGFRSLSPRDLIVYTGAYYFGSDPTALEATRVEGDEVELVHFQPSPSSYDGEFISIKGIAEEYARRGLVPDPYAQARDCVNHANFDSICFWQDQKGDCYSLVLYKWERALGVRMQCCRVSPSGWHSRTPWQEWRFCGSRPVK